MGAIPFTSTVYFSKRTPMYKVCFLNLAWRHVGMAFSRRCHGKACPATICSFEKKGVPGITDMVLSDPLPTTLTSTAPKGCWSYSPLTNVTTLFGEDGCPKQVAMELAEVGAKHGVETIRTLLHLREANPRHGVETTGVQTCCIKKGTSPAQAPSVWPQTPLASTNNTPKQIESSSLARLFLNVACLVCSGCNKRDGLA